MVDVINPYLKVLIFAHINFRAISRILQKCAKYFTKSRVLRNTRNIFLNQACAKIYTREIFSKSGVREN